MDGRLKNEMKTNKKEKSSVQDFADSIRDDPKKIIAMNKFKVNEKYIMWGFRYALGRRTGAVLDALDTLKRVWQNLPPFTQTQIKDEIERAIEIGWAGDKCDVARWTEILSLRDRDEQKQK